MKTDLENMRKEEVYIKKRNKCGIGFGSKG